MGEPLRSSMFSDHPCLSLLPPDNVTVPRQFADQRVEGTVKLYRPADHGDMPDPAGSLWWAWIKDGIERAFETLKIRRYLSKAHCATLIGRINAYLIQDLFTACLVIHLRIYNQTKEPPLPLLPGRNFGGPMLRAYLFVLRAVMADLQACDRTLAHRWVVETYSRITLMLLREMRAVLADWGLAKVTWQSVYQMPLPSLISNERTGQPTHKHSLTNEIAKTLGLSDDRRYVTHLPFTGVYCGELPKPLFPAIERTGKRDSSQGPGDPRDFVFLSQREMMRGQPTVKVNEELTARYHVDPPWLRSVAVSPPQSPVPRPSDSREPGTHGQQHEDLAEPSASQDATRGSSDKDDVAAVVLSHNAGGKRTQSGVANAVPERSKLVQVPFPHPSRVGASANRPPKKTTVIIDLCNDDDDDVATIARVAPRVEPITAISTRVAPAVVKESPNDRAIQKPKEESSTRRLTTANKIEVDAKPYVDRTQGNNRPSANKSMSAVEDGEIVEVEVEEGEFCEDIGRVGGAVSMAGPSERPVASKSTKKHGSIDHAQPNRQQEQNKRKRDGTDEDSRPPPALRTVLATADRIPPVLASARRDRSEQRYPRPARRY